MTVDHVKAKGELLGECPLKGYVYSVPMGRDQQGNKKYAVVSVLLGEVTYHIIHTVTQ